MRKIREKKKGKIGKKFIRLVSSSPEPAHESWSRNGGSDRCSVRGGVAEDEGPPTRREDDDSGLSTAQSAELAGLLEESYSTLGEGAPRIFSSRFFLFLSHVFQCCVLFHHICVCHN